MEKYPISGLMGPAGPFILNFKFWVAQNDLCRIILLHGDLATLNFHFPKIRKYFSFMIFGPRGHVHDPKTNFCRRWRHQIIDAREILDARLIRS